MSTYPSEIRGAEHNTESIKERFGGIDTPAALSGMLAALGVIVFVGALIAAGAGGLDYQLNAIDLEGNFEEVAIGGAIAAVLIVFVAFFVGGWAAGRIARFNGVMNGIGAALWMLLLIAVSGALGVFFGAEYNAFQQAGLPDWFSQFRGDDVTTAAVIAGAVLIVAMFAGAAIGGAVGDAYNRRVDAALTDDSIRREGIYRTETTREDEALASDEATGPDEVSEDEVYEDESDRTDETYPADEPDETYPTDETRK